VITGYTSKEYNKIRQKARIIFIIIFEMSKMIEKYRILFAELLDNLRELYLTILPEYGRLTMW